MSEIKNHRDSTYMNWVLNRSVRTIEVARSFRLDPNRVGPYHATRIDDELLRRILPAPSQITLLSGPSGSGKSALLRQLRRIATARWIDLRDAPLANQPIVDCFANAALDEVLRMLSHVGLADVWTYLRTPNELSDGQRWRLRLAISLHQARQKAGPAIFAADEFAAILDRVTASIVARVLRRRIQGSLSAIVATSHDDLIDSLTPDVVARCDFGTIRVWKGGAQRIDAGINAKT
jgi:uncharacterized protein